MSHFSSTNPEGGSTENGAPTVADVRREAAPAVPEQAFSHWFDIESDDPAQLAKNLRRIGCPERFVQNAVVAAIDREFHARRREIKETVEDPAVRQLEFIELTEERNAVLQETLGIDWASAPSKEWGGLRRSRFIAGFCGFLEPEKAERGFQLYWRPLKCTRWDGELAKAMEPEKLHAARQEDYTTFREQVGEVMPEEQQLLVERFLYSLDFFDVWDPKQQFGRDMSQEELFDAVHILMPPDYWQKRFELPLKSLSIEALVEDRRKAMAERFGDEVVEHFRSFKSYTPNMLFPKK